jgi:hypothetical protein
MCLGAMQASKTNIQVYKRSIVYTLKWLNITSMEW